jgi:hypothetical protein
MDDQTAPVPPDWVKLQSAIPLQSKNPDVTTVETVTSLGPDAINTHYPDLVISLSDRRKGMSLANALDIAAGRARRTPKT